jgi:hypothetical protein
VARYQFTLVNGDEGEIEIPNLESETRAWIPRSDEPGIWVQLSAIAVLEEIAAATSEPTTSEEVALASDQELAKLVGEAPAT